MELTIQNQLPPSHPAPPPEFWTKAKNAARRLLVDAGKPGAEVSVVLCDDSKIHALNRQWRNKDKPTDVLSWPLSDGDEEPLDGQENMLGDVVISVDTAQKQADARQWDVEDEIALLLVHGILHLLGHEDDSLAGSNTMKKIETAILGKPLDKVDTKILLVTETIHSAGIINP